MSTLNQEPPTKDPTTEERTPLDALQEELEEAFPTGGDPAAPPPGPEQPAGEVLDENMMRMFLSVPFDYIAARKGPHWKLTPEEQAAVLPVAVKVSNKYAPEMLKRWGDEIALVVLLGMILMKRVNIDSEIAAQKDPKENPPAAA